MLGPQYQPRERASADYDTLSGTASEWTQHNLGFEWHRRRDEHRALNLDFAKPRIGHPMNSFVSICLGPASVIESVIESPIYAEIDGRP